MFIKIDPDRKNFNVFKEINKIHRHVKKSTKKSLINDLSKRLLELEFKSNHSIKSKCLKWIVKKILPDYKEWKTQSEINPRKRGRKPRARYCLGCKDYIDHFKPQEIKITNK